MPFIGNQPAEKYSAFTKQDFSTSATTSYTLSQAVANENEIALFINFVRQEPTTAYTASGTSLTLTSATASSDDMYCVYLGKAVQTVNPPSGSVGSSQVASTIITGQTAETSIATDDLILLSDTSASGALRKMTRANFVSGIGGTNTPSWLAHNNSGDTISTATYVKVELDTVVHDTDSGFDTTNDKYTIPSGQGVYYQLYGVVNARNTSNQIKTVQTIFYKNGSALSNKYAKTSVNNTDSGSGIFRGFSNTLTTTVNLSAGDYLEMYTYIDVTSGSAIVDEISYFGGNKLIT